MTKKAGGENPATPGEEPPLTGRILCINDFPIYSEMVASFLEREGGHTVKTEIVPVTIDAIASFEPDVVIVNLVRRLETISAGGMSDFYTDVDGAKAFRAISTATKAGELNAPIIVTSLAVLERELPKEDCLEHIAFVEIPQKMDNLLAVIRQTLVAKASGGTIAPK